MNKAAVWRAISVAVAESGLSKKHAHISTHTLRHSFGTHMLEGGASVRQVTAYLGHSRPKEVIVYLHLTEISETKGRDALSTLADCWGRPVLTATTPVALHLADLLGGHWENHARAHRHQLTNDHYRAVRRVLACRTAELGGRVYQCDGCSEKHYACHSRNHRSCPQCGALDAQIWTARQEARLPPVPYFMVTLTLPEELRALCQTQPEIRYPLLLRQSAAALQDVCATKHHGAKPGFTSVLHTWGRQIQHHPRVHLIVPGIAFHPKHQTLHHPAKEKFLIHYQPLAARFRSRLHRALRDDHPELYQTLTPQQRHVLSPAKNWNVQLQHAGSVRTALRYLARCVQRSAFAAKRLLGYDKQGNVLLRWTSSATGKTAVMALPPREFIRRWLLHVLPKGLTRIRHYGFLGSAARKTRLRIRAMLGEIGEPAPRLPAPIPFTCQCCGGVLTFLREIAPIRLLRGPPRLHPPA